MASTNRYPGLEPRVLALVRHHASRLAASDHRLEQEDMEQELLLHLHVQAGRFDARRASYRTYADRVVHNRAAILARDARAAKRGHGTTILSISDLTRDNDQGSAGLADDGARSGAILEAEAGWEELAALRFELARFLSSLPPTPRDCCLLLLEHTRAETARIMGCHRSSVHAWLVVLRKRAQAAGLDIYVAASPTVSAAAE